MVFLKIGMERALGRRQHERRRHGERRRASRLHASGQCAACLHRCRPCWRPQEYARQHAGGDPHGSRARRYRGSHGRGERRRLGEQVQVHHAQSVGQHRRLGVEDRADHGRGLVSAGHAGHRHRRQRGEGDGAGQGSADGADRPARTRSGADPPIVWRSCGWRSTKRSTRWASARRGWAG